MKARVVTVEQLRKGGPFIGPKGGLWADPQHTVPWHEPTHGKIKPSNCPRCKGLAHIVSRQTSLVGEDSITSAPCRTCNRKGTIPFDAKKARGLGLPVPPSEDRAESAPATQARQLGLDFHQRPDRPPQQVSLFEKSLPVKARMVVSGLPVAIENPKGSKRRWYDPVKKEHGETVMVHPYGYITGTKGADGEEVDAFVGPHLDSKLVVIINQRAVDNLRAFDEHKVMLGFRSEKEARDAYLKNYDSKGPALMGTVRVWTIDRFKRWLENGNTTTAARKSLR